MKLNNLLSLLSKKDNNFKKLLKINKNIDFIKIDNTLYQNINYLKDNKQYPWEDICINEENKKFSFIAIFQNKKIYIWIWVDKLKHITEIEFYSLVEINSKKIIENVYYSTIAKEFY